MGPALDGGDAINIGACFAGRRTGLPRNAVALLSFEAAKASSAKPIADFQATANFQSWPTWRPELDAGATADLARGGSCSDAKVARGRRPGRPAMGKPLSRPMVGFQVVNEALQLHGGYGYLKRLSYRALFCATIAAFTRSLEGTNEIMAGDHFANVC